MDTAFPSSEFDSTVAKFGLSKAVEKDSAGCSNPMAAVNTRKKWPKSSNPAAQLISRHPRILPNQMALPNGRIEH